MNGKSERPGSRLGKAAPSLILVTSGLALLLTLETLTDWPNLQNSGIVAAYTAVGIWALKRLELWEPYRVGDGSLLNALAIAGLLALIVVAVAALGGLLSL